MNLVLVNYCSYLAIMGIDFVGPSDATAVKSPAVAKCQMMHVAKKSCKKVRKIIQNIMSVIYAMETISRCFSELNLHFNLLLTVLFLCQPSHQK